MKLQGALAKEDVELSQKKSVVSLHIFVPRVYLCRGGISIRILTPLFFYNERQLSCHCSIKKRKEKHIRIRIHACSSHFFLHLLTFYEYILEVPVDTQNWQKLTQSVRAG
jgi:hypothetical protein